MDPTIAMFCGKKDKYDAMVRDGRAIACALHCKLRTLPEDPFLIKEALWRRGQIRNVVIKQQNWTVYIYMEINREPAPIDDEVVKELQGKGNTWWDKMGAFPIYAVPLQREYEVEAQLAILLLFTAIKLNKTEGVLDAKPTGAAAASPVRVAQFSFWEATTVFGIDLLEIPWAPKGTLPPMKPWEKFS